MVIAGQYFYSMPPQKSKSPAYECTACCKVIRSTFNANIHPLLDCLICRDCYYTYGDGDFKNSWEDGVDENGDDNYCRWCCDGGDLFGCMNEKRCHYSFCKDCIKKNVPNDPILKSEEQATLQWICYACDKSKIQNLREEARNAMIELNQLGFRKVNASFTPGELRRRFAVLRKTRDTCLGEVTSKFDNLFDLLSSGQSTNKKEVDMLIESFKIPFAEFNTILIGLKKLANSV